MHDHDRVLAEMVARRAQRMGWLAPDQRDELVSCARAWALGRLRRGWLDGDTRRSVAARLSELARQAVRMAKDHVVGGRRDPLVLDDPTAPGPVAHLPAPGFAVEARVDAARTLRRTLDVADRTLGDGRLYELLAFEAPGVLPILFPDDPRNAAVLAARTQLQVAVVLAPGREPRQAANTLSKRARATRRRLVRALADHGADSGTRHG